MFGLREVVDANSDRRARMNEKELVSRYGIVRVKGYWRSLPGEWGTFRLQAHVRSHYRAAPGSGPLGGP